MKYVNNKDEATIFDERYANEKEAWESIYSRCNRNDLLNKDWEDYDSKRHVTSPAIKKLSTESKKKIEKESWKNSEW